LTKRNKINIIKISLERPEIFFKISIAKSNQIKV